MVSSPVYSTRTGSIRFSFSVDAARIKDPAVSSELSLFSARTLIAALLSTITAQRSPARIRFHFFSFIGFLPFRLIFYRNVEAFLLKICSPPLLVPRTDASGFS